MATGPKVATTPLELFANDSSRRPPLINKFWGPGLVGGIALISVIYGKWAMRRPLWSGIQLHIGLTALGAFVGKKLDDYRIEYFAERDATLQHYIQLHSEDFPPFDRKKYSEVLYPWIPIR